MRIWLAFIVATTVFGSVPSEAGQDSAGGSAASRPYRGLFGPTIDDEQRPPKLTLTLSLHGGFDDNSRFAGGTVNDDTLQTGRHHQGAQASLAYLRRRPKSSLSIDLSSAVRYYNSLRQIGTQQHSGSIRFELSPARQLRLQVAQNASFSPSYQLALGRPDPDAAEAFSAASVDYSVAREKQIAYGSYAAMTYLLTDRSELAFDYTHRQANFFTRPDFSSRRASARYSVRVGPGVDLRLGYGNGTAGLAGGHQAQFHDLDVGLTYGRAFLFSPRTSLTFASGSTIVATEHGRRVPIVGSVQLRRQFARRWSGDVGYQRHLQFVDTVAEPLQIGTVTGSVTGYLNARTRLRFAPSYAMGAAVTESSQAFQSLINESRAEFALTHYWALYVEHFYYRYRFEGTPLFPGFLGAGLNRQGVRGGLALWAPVARR